MVRLRTKQENKLDGKGKPTQPTKADDEAYQSLVDSFKDGHGGSEVQLAIFGAIGAGAYLTPDNRIQAVVLEGLITFDWTDAQRLLDKVDSTAEQAREWWPYSKPERRRRQAPRTQGADPRPHLERAFGLLSGTFAAVVGEQRRIASVEGSNDDAAQKQSPTYRRNIARLRGDASRAEGRLRFTAQRHALELYGDGMRRGIQLVALCSLVVGGIFWYFEVPAYYGVSFPAGAIGAYVSVFQRMTSKRGLTLDFNAGWPSLHEYGTMRPVVGGVLGLAVFALIISGLALPLESDSGRELAFYAGIGFLAGFNERFAQDMLAGTGEKLTKKLEAEEEEEQDAAGTAEQEAEAEAKNGT